MTTLLSFTYVAIACGIMAERARKTTHAITTSEAIAAALWLPLCLLAALIAIAETVADGAGPRPGGQS